MMMRKKGTYSRTQIPVREFHLSQIHGPIERDQHISELYVSEESEMRVKQTKRCT